MITHLCSCIKTSGQRTSSYFESTEKDALRFPCAIGHPYLVGYDGVREENEASLYADVTDWQRTIYISKERLGQGQAKSQILMEA
jgi:hypothetical protein